MFVRLFVVFIKIVHRNLESKRPIIDGELKEWIIELLECNIEMQLLLKLEKSSPSMLVQVSGKLEVYPPSGCRFETSF